MSDTLSRARDFMLTHARLLERRLFEVQFAGAYPASVAQVVRACQNADGGLGHALEPDLRCPESQPLFVEVGLAALCEAGCRDSDLALSVCAFLESASNEAGLVPLILDTALESPHASHMGPSAVAPDLNPTAGLCGLLHYQGVQHPWLSRATETCCDVLIRHPPLEAHTLLGATRLADHLPDRALAGRLYDAIASALPRARFFIAEAPVEGYGLTPLHFAPRPESKWRVLFSDAQIDGHLRDLIGRQQPDGGWPITWEAPGPAAVLEWRGRWTLEAVCTLAA
ncbi:MAG TPA: hypothetical protein VM366_15700, partial [Anaerolineae bacterium]|nr:hypothetical protein [Anaerolineae bacterium]